MKTAIRHTGFFVTNLEESVKFFKQFGFKEIYRQDENWNGEILKISKLKLGESVLELIGDDYNCRNFYTRTHIALTVKDINKIYNKLKKNKNVIFEDKPRLSPDKSAKVAFCRGSSSIRIELVEEVQ